MPDEPTPEDQDVFIWEHCDLPSSGTVIGQSASSMVLRPSSPWCK